MVGRAALHVRPAELRGRLGRLREQAAAPSAAGAISVGGGGSSIVSPARPAASTCTAWFCCSVILWPCDVSSRASPLKILTPVCAAFADVDVPARVLRAPSSQRGSHDLGRLVGHREVDAARLDAPGGGRGLGRAADVDDAVGAHLDDAAGVEGDLGAGARLGLHHVADVQLRGERGVAPRLPRVRLDLHLPSTAVRRAICWPGFGTGLRTKKYQ